MADFAPMGEANYNYYLKHVLLLPLSSAEVEMIGRVETARFRAVRIRQFSNCLQNRQPSVISSGRTRWSGPNAARRG